MPCFTIPAQAPSAITARPYSLDHFTEKLEASVQLWSRQESVYTSSSPEGLPSHCLGRHKAASVLLTAPHCFEKHFSFQWLGRKCPKAAVFGSCRNIFTHILVQKLENKPNAFSLPKESTVKLAPEWSITGERAFVLGGKRCGEVVRIIQMTLKKKLAWEIVEAINNHAWAKFLRFFSFYFVFLGNLSELNNILRNFIVC